MYIVALDKFRYFNWNIITHANTTIIVELYFYCMFVLLWSGNSACWALEEVRAYYKVATTSLLLVSVFLLNNDLLYLNIKLSWVNTNGVGVFVIDNMIINIRIFYSKYRFMCV